MQVHIVLPFFFIYVIVFVSPSKAHILSLVSSKEIVILYKKDLLTFSIVYKLQFQFFNNQVVCSCQIFIKKMFVWSPLHTFHQYIHLANDLCVTKTNFTRLTVIVSQWIFVVCKFLKRIAERILINFSDSLPLHLIFETTFI